MNSCYKENQEQEYCHIENQVAGENMFLAMVCLSICLHCDHETLLQICHSISDSKHKASYNITQTLIWPV